MCKNWISLCKSKYEFTWSGIPDKLARHIYLHHLQKLTQKRIVYSQVIFSDTRSKIILIFLNFLKSEIHLPTYIRKKLQFISKMRSKRLKLIRYLMALYILWDQSKYTNIFYGENGNYWMQVINIRGSFKMLPGSLYFWEIQNSTIT